MKRTIGCQVTVLVMLCLGIFVATARADNLDFQCGTGGSFCAGTVTFSGTVTSASATSITNVVEAFNHFPGKTFTLAFNTGLGTMSLNSGSGDTLSGTFSSFGSFCGSVECSITVSVFWDTLSASVAAALGAPQGIDLAHIGWNRDTGAVTSVDISITPIPEPSSLALFGTGLIGIAGLIRRKLGA
jgi:hypothetical protein